ncbi:hypothetical protein C8R43DRAFT_1116090 [Mycena crocata]|nr:hypothetical protein C8R43DRAFT_1116090 [Mycena crocata]
MRPILRKSDPPIPTSRTELPHPTKQNKIIDASQATTVRIRRQLLEESKHEIAENGTSETGRGRDLWTLLVPANTSKEIPESQCLSDDSSQVDPPWLAAEAATFLVAGHETTSTAVTWALFALTEQNLRSSLPYLEYVVRGPPAARTRPRY